MTDSLTIIVQPSGQVIAGRHGDRLLDLAREAGAALESICGGAGECGKCRVIVNPPGAVEESEGSCRHAPSPAERAQGYVFACRSRLIADCTMHVPVESRIISPKILMPVLVGPDEIDPGASRPRSSSSTPRSTGNLSVSTQASLAFQSPEGHRSPACRPSAGSSAGM